MYQTAGQVSYTADLYAKRHFQSFTPQAMRYHIVGIRMDTQNREDS